MPAEPTTRAAPRNARRAAALLAALAAALLAAPLAAASVPTYKGASADGTIVFFETTEKLAEGDTDNKRDVYLRSYDPEAGEAGDYVTRIVSTGPDGGNDAYDALFEKTSADGSRVFFSTDERLVAADTDRSTDVYMREPATGTTTLVSAGAPSCAPACGNDERDAHFAGASGDGSEVFFVSDERLAAGDTDSSFDIYVRTLGVEGVTSLVTAGTAACAPACGNGAFDTFFWGVSADGSHAYFTSAEKLAEADLDSAVDIYARDLAGAGTTTLVSRGECSPACGNSGTAPVFQGSSADGDRVFFTTAEKLVDEDEDTVTDVYARDLPAGPTILISSGQPTTHTSSFAAASADGAHVFLATAEQLVGEDEDGVNDIYEWSGGGFNLISSAECSSSCGVNFDAASADSEEVVYSTAEPLSGEDADSAVDIYRQHVGGGAPVLVSRGGAGCAGCGNAEVNAGFNRASADAEHVFFASVESLTTDDGDVENDIFARDIAGEETNLITTSPSYCPFKEGEGNCGATLVGVSIDGLRVFFTTVERFTLDDGDNEIDVYERFLGSSPEEEITRLVSTGNNPNLELGPAEPKLTGTDPESPGVSTTPRIIGEADAETSIKLYTQAGCSGEVKKTGTAAELSGAGLQVGVASGSKTSFWATSSDENGDTSACSNSLTYQHDAPSSPAGGGGGGGGASGGGTIAVGPAKPAGPTYVVPHTRITFAPAAKTRARRPVFRFVDSTGQDGTRFRCKLDRKRWRGCGSPVRVKKKLGRGRHVFAVRAVNAAGVWERKPTRRRFKVVAKGGKRGNHRRSRSAR